MTFLRFLLAFVVASSAGAATLPGFRIETIAQAPGFASSVVTDSRGVIYLTTTDGWIHRVDGAQTTPVASLPTRSGGNGGLLGMALLDDDTAVVHYTTWNGEEAGEHAAVLDDVISRVDLRRGSETVLHKFVCDITGKTDGASSEHHGGNPAVGPDRSIFVGIGDYGSYIIAQKPEWNAGKIWRIDEHGTVSQWARGMRNPYDLVWDPDLGSVVVSDNGPNAGDEIHIVDQGDNCGWPQTYGAQSPVDGANVPAYVFPETVAPTGLLRLNGNGSMLRRGYLMGAFVTRAIYYFPQLSTAPIAIAEELDEYVIDIAQMPNGELVFVTANFAGTSSIHRLHRPQRGDCNGDGFVDGRDLYPMFLEARDGGSHPMITAQNGDHRGSWGCDVNADERIDAADLQTLSSMLATKRRAVR